MEQTQENAELNAADQVEVSDAEKFQQDLAAAREKDAEEEAGRQAGKQAANPLDIVVDDDFVAEVEEEEAYVPTELEKELEAFLSKETVAVKKEEESWGLKGAQFKLYKEAHLQARRSGLSTANILEKKIRFMRRMDNLKDDDSFVVRVGNRTQTFPKPYEAAIKAHFALLKVVQEKKLK